MSGNVIPMRGRGQEPPKTQRKRKVRYKQTFDYTMIVSLVLLLCIGLVMVYSASYYVAEVSEESGAYYFLKQFICVAIGALLML